jgi:O-antigen ligase
VVDSRVTHAQISAGGARPQGGLALYMLLLIAYAVLAPVYWLPGVSFEIMAAVKFALFGATVLMAVMIAGSPRVRIPVGPLGLGLIPIVSISAILGLVQTDLASIGRFYVDFGSVALALFCGMVAGQVISPLAPHLRRYVIATAVIAVAAIFLAPTEADRLLSRYGEEIVGFTTGRTAWSNGLALPATLAAAMALSTGQTLKQRMPYILAFLAIFAAQVVVGGRAGILASIVAIAICAGPLKLFGSMRGQMVLILGAALVGALVYANLDFIMSEFRLNTTRIQGRSALDNLTSGRITTYEIAWRYIQSKPLSGYGFGDWSVSGLWGRNFVHNGWLKYLYQGGVFYFLTLLFLKAALFMKALRADRLPGPDRFVVFTPVLIAGLFITLFEPNMLIGVFQKSAFWWFAAGMAMGELYAFGRYQVTSPAQTRPGPAHLERTTAQENS